MCKTCQALPEARPLVREFQERCEEVRQLGLNPEQVVKTRDTLIGPAGFKNRPATPSMRQVLAKARLRKAFRELGRFHREWEARQHGNDLSGVDQGNDLSERGGQPE